MLYIGGDTGVLEDPGWDFDFSSTGVTTVGDDGGDGHWWDPITDILGKLPPIRFGDVQIGSGTTPIKSAPAQQQTFGKPFDWLTLALVVLLGVMVLREGKR